MVRKLFVRVITEENAIELEMEGTQGEPVEVVLVTSKELHVIKNMRMGYTLKMRLNRDVEPQKLEGIEDEDED
jgi:hypothetical protein